jgi:predicted XRE-type DNA-binding protein
MTTWITQHKAAEILGVHKSRVAKLVAQGNLKSRGGRKASLDRSEVAALAEWRAGAPQRAQEARAHRAAERAAERTWRSPPDDDHDWLSVSQVAELLGVTRVAVGKRCARGRLPYTEHGGMRWVRRDLLELVQNARKAKRQLQA